MSPNEGGFIGYITFEFPSVGCLRFGDFYPDDVWVVDDDSGWWIYSEYDLYRSSLFIDIG